MLEDTVSGHTVIPAPGATTFTLSQTVPAGSSYAVTVIAQPTSPAQSCTITSGANGTANANVTNVVVSCTNAYTIGGTITGTLTGTGLVIKDSVSGNTTTVAPGATTFTIMPAVASGSSYSVSVMTQPSGPTEACSVTSGGTGHATSNVTSVVVHCSITSFTVGGTITGYAGSGLVLKDTVNNHQLTVPVNATTFAITPAIPSGSTYTVAVLTNPATPTQACTITSGASGTVGAGNVTSVVVSCVTSTFTVGGTISGLTGTGLVLTDSVSGHTATPAALDTSFTLTPAVNSGTTYNVTVTTQPTGPQFCSVTGGTGTVTTMNVATIGVSCVNVGKFVFVTNANDNSIAALSINASSGALTLIGGAPLASTDATPVAAAVDPTGNYLYVADAGAANVDTYNIGANGALTATILSTGTGTGSVPWSLALDPLTDDLYVGSDVTPNPGTVGGYAISNGALAGVAGSPYADGNIPYGIAVDPANGLLFAANNTDGTIGCFPINPDGTLGALSTLTFQGGGGVNGPYALVVAPGGGNLYVTDTIAAPNTVTAYSYTDCSALTQIGSAKSVGSAAESVAIDPTGKYLYVANSGDATVSGFTITAGTGALTSIGTATATGAAASTSPTALIVDPSSQYLYVANGDDGTVSLLTIGAGGALTLVGTPLSTVSTTGGQSGIAIE
jgi:6-phosphogluconolactonase (cycloisomerase 2 family)